MRLALASVALFSLVLAGPCASPPPTTSLPGLSYAAFVQQVEPELLGSCGFSNCHGAAVRPMRLYAPAGSRIRPGLSTDGLLPEEHEANFDRVRSFAAATSAQLPDLLRKPLQLEAGGAGHTGVDRYGRNVYPSKDDPRWRLLESWVGGKLDGGVLPDAGEEDGGTLPPGCQPGPYGYAAKVAPIVNLTTCADSACHSKENTAAGDAGCFDPDTCQSVLASGCGNQRTVRACDPFRSKLYRYTGVAPFFKSHQGKLLPQHALVIGEWIDAGAPCD